MNGRKIYIRLPDGESWGTVEGCHLFIVDPGVEVTNNLEDLFINKQAEKHDLTAVLRRVVDAS